MKEDILQRAIQEINTYGDLDGIEDIRPLAPALENLIKGYKELTEENKELHKEINQRVKLKLENERIVDEDYIPKSKVREEIEDIIDYFEHVNVPDEDIEFLEHKKEELLQEGDTNATKM